MYKNIAIGVLLLITIAEGGYILTKKPTNQSTVVSVQNQNTASPRPAPPQPLSPGMKLSDSQISQFAYKVAPGELDDNAKAALVGWNISSQTQKDGSTVVTLTPKNSDDQKQVYTVKSGDMLYFVEMTKSDDDASSNEDKNLRDDYGIITDANGIIQ